MQTVSSGFEDVATANVQNWVYQVVIALGDLPTTDVSSYVSSVSIDEQMTTDMPNGTRPSGYPSRSATIVLAGAAADWFNPYNTASPIYRTPALYVPVTVDLGFTVAGSSSPELVRKFTGTIDAYTYDPITRTVEFDCIDGRGRLRSTVDVPAVSTAPPFNAGLTSEYVMDAALRANSGGAISSWPARRPNCVFAAGMRTSLWAEVGTLTGGVQQPPSFAPGKFGSALSEVITDATGVVWSVTPTTAQDVFIEFWVTDVSTTGAVTVMLSAGTGGLIGYVELGAFGATGNVSVTVGSSSGIDTFSYSTGGFGTGAHYISAHVTWAPGSSSWQATITYDAASSSSGSRTVAARTSTPFDTVRVLPGSSGAVPTLEAVQISNESGPASNYGFVPQAVLDPSLNPLQVVPPITGSQDPFQTIQDLTEAEQGFSGFDETGVFRFRNRTTLAASTAVRTITSLSSLVSLQVQLDAASLYDQTQVEYQPYTFQDRAIVWSLDTATKVAAGQTVTIEAALDNLAVDVDTSISRSPSNDSTQVTGQSYYRSSTDQYGTSSGPTLTVTAQQVTTQKVLITVTNPSGSDAWLVSSSDHIDVTVGDPFLVLGGIPVPAGDPGTATVGTTTVTTTYQLTGNPWIQDPTTAGDVAYYLYSDMETPKPMLNEVQIAPDPALQLADKVTLQDPTIVDINHDVQIWSNTIDLASDGQSVSYTQTIDARALAFPS